MRISEESFKVRNLSQILRKWHGSLATPRGSALQGMAPRALAGLACVATALLARIAEAGGEAHGGHHGDLTINWWRWETAAPPVGWFILDFILFVGLIVYFARRPIRDVFLARHKRIKKAIEDAEAAHREAAARYEDYRDKLANVEVESATHVERGKVDGALERDQIIAAAREYAERLQLDVKAVIDQEFNRARDRVQHQAVIQLLSQTEALLRQTLTDRDRERLLDEAIAQLGHQQPTTPVSRRRSGGTPPAAESAS